MASRRMIDPAFWQNETVSELTIFERLLYLGMIAIADDRGNINSSPSWLRSRLFPFEEIPALQIQQGIDRMSVRGLVSRVTTADSADLIVWAVCEEHERLREANNWLTVHQLILERDGWYCHYCGEPAWHVDHVLPRCQGGTDDPENLVAACTPCNLSKGGRTPEQAGMELR